MMRLLMILLSLVIAVAIGISLHRYSGVMIVTFAGWRVDMPLWLPILGIVLVYFVFHYLSVIIRAMLSAIQSLGTLRQRYRLKRAKAQTQEGYRALTLGEYEKASKLLVKGASQSELPWLNYLSAAKAAQAQGDISSRDACLAKAAECVPDDDMPVKMTACEFASEQGDWQTSLSLLKTLEHNLPNNPHVIQLLKNVYVEQKNWTALRELFPKIKQAHILTRTGLIHLEQQLWQGLLMMVPQSDIVTIKALWKEMPDRCQNDPVLINQYAQLLIQHHQSQEAEKLLRVALDKQWNEALIKRYGQIDFLEPKKALATAEKWLTLHMDSPGLLTALGQMCDRMDLWEMAQRYYEASLSLSATPQAYAALGKHWEKLNRPELGAEYFKKGLALTIPSSFTDS